MEEVIETTLSAIWAVIKFIFWHLLFSIILFNIGRIALLIITLGKYPRLSNIEKDRAKITFFGLFVILSPMIFLSDYSFLIERLRS